MKAVYGALIVNHCVSLHRAGDVVSCIPWRSLDVFSELDAEVIFAEIRVLFPDLLHGVLLRFFHVLLVAHVVVVMRRTLASHPRDIYGRGPVPEVLVFFLGDVFAAVIADGAAAGTHDFVATAIFEDGRFAFRTGAEDGLRAGFLYLMTFTNAVLLFEFGAAERDVCDISAFAAADLLTFGISAGELLVDFDGRADGGEVAERAGFEIG